MNRAAVTRSCFEMAAGIMGHGAAVPQEPKRMHHRNATTERRKINEWSGGEGPGAPPVVGAQPRMELLLLLLRADHRGGEPESSGGGQRGRSRPAPEGLRRIAGKRR